MRMYKANIAYTAVSQSRMHQYTTTSGSWYRKTVTQPLATAAVAGAVVGVGYAIASTVFGSGGSVTRAQNGIFGATGNGWVQATAPGSAAQQLMVTNIASRFVAPQIGATTMTGTQALYKGSCPEGYTVGQCQQASLDPGTTWRPDSYTEYNSTRALRARMVYCTNTLHLTGTAAEQCAAPAAMQY
jgi:hypothetical protein